MDSSCKASGVASKRIVYMRGGGQGAIKPIRWVGLVGGGASSPQAKILGRCRLGTSDFLVQNMSGVKRSLLQKDSHVQALWQAFGVRRFLVQKPF